MPLARRPLVDDIVDYVTKKILFSEQYKQGDWLNESEIAAELRLSKAPLREATRILAQQGLVQIVPNKGVFIRVISPEELKEIGKIRLALEEIIFEEIVNRKLFQEDDYAFLKKLVDEMTLIEHEVKTKEDQARRFFELDVQFHEYLWKKTNLEWVKKILSEMYALIELGRYETLKKENIVEIVEKHRKILEAVNSSDLEKIKEANFSVIANFT